MTSRYFLKLAYHGKNYHGWQVQPNAVTVQELIAKALCSILKQEIDLVGCGRTDTGVHAKEFYAHFDYKGSLSKDDRERLCFKLNRFLPTDIVIFDVLAVKDEAHTRFDAVSRTYQYQVAKRKDPFNKEFSYYIYGEIDVKKMNKAAEALFQYEDFTSFSKSRTQTKTNNCKIMHALWKEEDDMLVFTIQADRFLRNMVRAVVGTLLDVGTGRQSIEQFRQIIESKSRCSAGYSVPAEGLFLTRIEYPEDIYTS